MKVYDAIVVAIHDNGLAVDVHVPELSTGYKHIPVFYPYYHTFRGEGTYQSIEIYAHCKLWIPDNEKPFVMGFGTAAQRSNKDTDNYNQYMVTAEKSTPGSAILKTRFGNKIIVERGGFNINFVTHLCNTVWTKIKNYMIRTLENLWSIVNGGWLHWWTDYKKKTVNMNVVIKNKKDWDTTQLMWISVGEEGKFADIVLDTVDLDKNRHNVFQFHINNDGQVYVKAPKISFDVPMTVFNGKVLVKGDVAFESNFSVNGETHIQGKLKVSNKIAAANDITSQKSVKCLQAMHAASYVVPGSANDASASQFFEQQITPPASTQEGFENPYCTVPKKGN